MMIDKHNPAIQAFVKEIEADIETHRTGLERVGKSEADTAVLRGRIKEARVILARINGDHEDNDPDS